MKTLRSKTAYLITLILIVLICGFSRAVSPVMAQNQDNVFISDRVALVNGDVLTEKEFLFTLEREYGGEGIQNLIENEIIAEEASKMGVSVEQNEIDEYLNMAYAPDKLQALVNAFGKDTLDKTIGTELLAFKVVSAEIDKVIADNNIEITDEKIQEFYLANLPLWIEPESVRFSLIETATEADTIAAKNRINAGEDFAKVCTEVSTHPATRAFGGDIGGLVPKGSSTGERIALEDTAFALDIGAVSDPIKVEDKWYLVMPTEKTEYKQPTLEEMRDKIHATLLDKTVEPYLEKWRGEIWKSADFEIKYPVFLETDLSGFIAGADSSFIAPFIATVNGRDITEREFLFHLLRAHGSAVIQASIENILFMQQAKGKNINISVENAREQINKIYPDPNLVSLLDTAFTPNAVNGTIIRELTALKVIGSEYDEIVKQEGINVSDDEIMTYYLQNLKRWTNPDLVRFSMIIVPSEQDAVSAKNRILKGETFEAVCSDVSIDEGTRDYGGDIGDFVPKGLFKGDYAIIEETAFELPVGAVSDPIKVGANWLVLKITDKKDAYEPTLAEKRDDIRAMLLQDKVTPFIYGWRHNLWENADITVVYPIYSDNPSPEFSEEKDNLLIGK
ncbi:MAG: peptidyl-prolyl cis-trans isomerase [bacterium]